MNDTSPRNDSRRDLLHARQRAARDSVRRRRRLRWWLSLGTFAAMAALVAGMLLTSQTTSRASRVTAPDFTLPTTAGATTTLSALRGRPVLLYFSEGAGCDACLMQMAAIEKDRTAFDALGVTVLPIVMNSTEQITAELNRYSVTTPFLVDDGTVSRAYGTLGTGMHADLPGHSFVLIDAVGVQRWYGDYPSMWLDPGTLADEIRTRLQG